MAIKSTAQKLAPARHTLIINHANLIKREFGKFELPDEILKKETQEGKIASADALVKKLIQDYPIAAHLKALGKRGANRESELNAILDKFATVHGRIKKADAEARDTAVQISMYAKLNKMGGDALCAMMKILGKTTKKQDKLRLIGAMREIASISTPVVYRGLEGLKGIITGTDMEMAVAALWTYAHSTPSRSKLAEVCNELQGKIEVKRNTDGHGKIFFELGKVRELISERKL
jgi:hypothetical protein